MKIKLLDFGLSYVKRQVNNLPSEKMGTLSFIAPEIAKGFEYTKVLLN